LDENSAFDFSSILAANSSLTFSNSFSSFTTSGLGSLGGSNFVVSCF